MNKFNLSDEEDLRLHFSIMLRIILWYSYCSAHFVVF